MFAVWFVNNVVVSFSEGYHPLNNLTYYVGGRAKCPSFLAWCRWFDQN